MAISGLGPPVYHHDPMECMQPRGQRLLATDITLPLRWNFARAGEALRLGHVRQSLADDDGELEGEHQHKQGLLQHNRAGSFFETLVSFSHQTQGKVLVVPFGTFWKTLSDFRTSKIAVWLQAAGAKADGRLR